MSAPDVLRTLGRIEGKQDLMLQIMTEDRKRLQAVEKKVWYGSGIAGVLAFIIARFTFNLHT